MATSLLRVVLIMLISSVFTACSSIPSTPPIAPTVELDSVKPVKIGLRKQELSFKLNINNPNPYDLPLQSLSFIAEIEGSEVAQGISNEPVTLPANSDALVEVIVSTRLNRLLAQIFQLAGSDNNTVNYDVNGFVKLANWPLKIPFSVDGDLSP